MLLGTGSGGGQSFNIDPAMGLHSFGFYVQDQWRATSRLTVNIGVRYENQRPATERFNRLEYFNTTVVNPISSALGFTVHGGFEYAGINGNNRYAWPANNKDFAPRAGLAFKITNRLVARAGAGIYFLPPSAMISFDNPGQFLGFSSSTAYNATTQNGYVPLNLVSNPFPNGLNQPTGGSQGLFTLVGDGQSQIWPKAPHPTPYSEQWSFDLQYQVSSHSVFQDRIYRKSRTQAPVWQSEPQRRSVAGPVSESAIRPRPAGTESVPRELSTRTHRWGRKARSHTTNCCARSLNSRFSIGIGLCPERDPRTMRWTSSSIIVSMRG